MSTKFKPKFIDWRPILAENEVKYPQLVAELREIGIKVTPDTLGKWIRGSNCMPDFVLGYLFGRFFNELD